jgi:U3 small nucleolar RNA-associated protein 24
MIPSSTWCVRAAAAAEPIALCSEKVSSALFFKYNTQLGPPYQVLVDTNFINFSIKNKVG